MSHLFLRAVRLRVAWGLAAGLLTICVIGLLDHPRPARADLAADVDAVLLERLLQ